MHGTGTQQTALDVIGNLGANGPNIVNFTGNTTQTVSTSDLMMMQGGSGQADVTGATISGNTTYGILSGDIFMTGFTGMTWIELGLTGTLPGGTVDFLITYDGGLTQAFTWTMGAGDTHIGFAGTGGDVINNVHYSAESTPGSFSLLKQVRIDSVANPVPEPATWMLMLFGFGGMGVALRRRRKVGLAQVA